MSDLRVPGMPMFMLVVGEGWQRAELVLPRTPPSMNDNAIRSHWRGFHTEKKSWQEEIGQLLMLARLPRNGERAIAGARMRFPRAGVATPATSKVSWRRRSAMHSSKGATSPMTTTSGTRSLASSSRTFAVQTRP
jgi:hypothetical protein